MQKLFPAAAFNERSKGYAEVPGPIAGDCKAGRHLWSARMSDDKLLCTILRAAARFRCDDEWRMRRERDAVFVATPIRYLDRRMSIYRKLKGVSSDNLHDFPRQRTASREPVPESEVEWRVRRKAKPCEEMLPTTATWYAGLPLTVQPKALRERFPRIANGLAAAWRDRDATLRYFDDLLSDRRGGRRGFPLDVLEELQRLKIFYEGLKPAPGDVWRVGSK